MDDDQDRLTMRISNETLEAIAVVVTLFLLAIFCMACQLNPRAVLGLRRRNNTTGDGQDGEPNAYSSIDDFVVGAEDGMGMVAVDGASTGPQPMTMQDIFPDLLGDEKKDNGGDEENLNEPLL